VKAIQAPNPTTVVITLNQAYPNFLQNLAQGGSSIVDPSVVEAHGGVQNGAVNTYMASHVAGSGPFLLQAYEPNKRAVLVPNPHFLGRPPGVKQIIVNFINSDSTLLLLARSGKADVTLGMSKQGANSLRHNPCCHIVANKSPFTEIIGLPWAMPPWGNLKVREAVTYAVPYQEILNKVAFGWGGLYYGPYPPAVSQFNAKISKPRKFDLNKAKALIKQSGLNTPVNVEMVIPEGDTIEQQIATIVQGVWRQIGINVKIRTLSASDYLTSLENHKVQAFVRLDGPIVFDAGHLAGYDMKCGVSFNLSDICIPQADNLVAQARIETNPRKSQQEYDQVAKLWIKNSPRIVVYVDADVAVLNKRVTHYFYEPAMDLRSWSTK
jgi:peptide/nickel transport system substrate-binding protein